MHASITLVHEQGICIQYYQISFGIILSLIAMTVVLPARLVQQLSPQSLGDATALIATAIASGLYLSNGTLWNKPDPYHHLWVERPTEALHDGSAVQQSRATRNIAQMLDETVSLRNHYRPNSLHIICKSVLILIETEKRRCNLLGLTIQDSRDFSGAVG